MCYKHHISKSLPTIGLFSVTHSLPPNSCRYSLSGSASCWWNGWWTPIISRRWEWKRRAVGVHAFDNVGNGSKECLCGAAVWTDSGYIRLVVVLNGESTYYLGPAVLHLIKMCCGWELRSASRRIWVTALFLKLSLKLLDQRSRGFQADNSQEMTSKELALPGST